MSLFEWVAAIIIGTAVCVILATPLIRHAYRRRITRLMGLNQVQPRPEAWWQAQRRSGSARRLETVAKPSDAAAIVASAAAREWRVTLASVVAWLVFTAFTVPVSMLAGTGETLDFTVGAGLLALGPLLVNLPRRFQRRALIIFTTVAIPLVAWTQSLEPDSQSDDPFWQVALAVLVFMALYLAMFHRRLRGLVMPVLVVVTVAVLTMFLVPALMLFVFGSNADVVVNAISEPGSVVGQWLKNSGVYLLMASLLLVALWVGFRAAGGLAGLMERGWLSELSMVGFIGLVIIAVGLMLGMVFEDAADHAAWLGLFPLIWVAISLIAYSAVLWTAPASGPGRDLLTLRVFSKNRRQQALLDQVQGRWRFIGAVNQAGGPDLVDLNIDPYECSMFLTGKMHELFLPEAVSGEQLRKRLDFEPDREGRYRVNEMFNFNTSWRGNVEQLILMSKTILLDLRGLTAEREGTSFEIGLLASHDLLSRLVVIGDKETDWSHVDEKLQSHGKNLSQVKQVKVDSPHEIDNLINELLSVAAGST
jgi:hypothetical protein